MNDVKISGKICNKKEFTGTKNTITRFGLNFYNGKDANGAAEYDFIDCVYIGKLEYADKTTVNIEGWLSVDNYINKSGQKVKHIQIMAKSVSLFEKKQTQTLAQSAPWDDDFIL